MNTNSLARAESGEKSAPLIECVDLIKIYSILGTEINIPALRGVNLKINEGEFIAFIGPSGSGKSTLLRLLAGNDRPTSGKVLFKRTLLGSLSGKDLGQYRQNIGFFNQLAEDNLFRELDLLQNIILPMLITSRFRGKEKKRASRLLETVGLKGKEKRKMNQLSGGEIQRAGLAAVLSKNPVLLLADEPTGELDTANTLEIIGLLKKLNRELGLTIIVVTHDNRFAREVDTVYRIRDGRVVSYSTILGEQDHLVEKDESVFIDPDGTLRLPNDIKEQLNLAEGDGIQFKEVNGKIIIEVVRRKKKNDQSGE